MSKEQGPASEPWIDPDDVPELTEEWFRQADLYQGGKLIRRGRRPKEGTSQETLYRQHRRNSSG